jgi:hypothetical protein
MYVTRGCLVFHAGQPSKIYNIAHHIIGQGRLQASSDLILIIYTGLVTTIVISNYQGILRITAPA